MAKLKATTWNRKGMTPSDVASLIACLTAAVYLSGGETTIPVEALALIDGAVGLRARFEDDGSITLWTYDVVDDIAKIHKDAQ